MTEYFKATKKIQKSSFEVYQNFKQMYRAARQKFVSHTYQLCNASDWDTVKYATRHLYFPYTHEPLAECV